MLRSIPDLPSGIVGVAAEGRVTGADYRTIWRPLLAAARRENERLRVLYRLGPDLDGFTGGALWEDLRLGFEYLHDLERCAVVSDGKSLRVASELAGAMVPCQVRTFEQDAEEAAVEWLMSSDHADGLAFRLLPECGVLLLKPANRTVREDVEEVKQALDAWSEEDGGIDAMVIVPTDPSSWLGPGSMLEHWHLLGAADRLERVAVVADRAAELTSATGDAFAASEVRGFAPERRAEAISWASGAGVRENATSGS